MKILFLGDSITEGCGASIYEKAFVPLVGKKLNAEVINYGVGGTRIARQKETIIFPTILNYDFNLRFEIMQKEADFVVVFGGTNDFAHGVAPLGNSNDKTVYTFYGALNTLYESLVKQYGKSKILALQLLPRASQDQNGDSPEVKNGTITPFNEYKKAIEVTAKKYGIRIADFSNNFPATVPYGSSEYFIDGLHPNDKGHDLLSDLVINEIKQMMNQ